MSHNDAPFEVKHCGGGIELVDAEPPSEKLGSLESDRILDGQHMTHTELRLVADEHRV